MAALKSSSCRERCATLASALRDGALPALKELMLDGNPASEQAVAAVEAEVAEVARRRAAAKAARERAEEATRARAAAEAERALAADEARAKKQAAAQAMAAAQAAEARLNEAAKAASAAESLLHRVVATLVVLIAIALGLTFNLLQPELGGGDCSGVCELTAAQRAQPCGPIDPSRLVFPRLAAPHPPPSLPRRLRCGL